MTDHRLLDLVTRGVLYRNHMDAFLLRRYPQHINERHWLVKALAGKIRHNYREAWWHNHQGDMG